MIKMRSCWCDVIIESINIRYPICLHSSSGYEDSLKSLQHQQQHLQHQHRTRGHDIRSGNNGNNNNKHNQSQLSHKRHRFHSFTNLESIYQPEPSSNNLQCDRRFQTMLLEQKQRQRYAPQDNKNNFFQK